MTRLLASSPPTVTLPLTQPSNEADARTEASTAQCAHITALLYDARSCMLEAQVLRHQAAELLDTANAHEVEARTLREEAQALQRIRWQQVLFTRR